MQVSEGAVEERILPPQSMDILKNFMEKKDLALLAKPIVFAKKESQFVNYICCALVVPGCIFSGGIMCCISPVIVVCPSKVAREFDFELDSNGVNIREAANDCCCHIAKSKKTIPLDKIQDIQVSQDCCQTCFDVKLISILTGGEGQAQVAFVDASDEVREGIKLATQLARSSATAPIAHNSMQEASRPGGAELAGRLSSLEQLVTRSVLSAAEAAELRVAFLAADRDYAHLLLQAATLRDSGKLSAAELDGLKARWTRLLSSP